MYGLRIAHATAYANHKSFGFFAKTKLNRNPFPKMKNKRKSETIFNMTKRVENYTYTSIESIYTQTCKRRFRSMTNNSNGERLQTVISSYLGSYSFFPMINRHHRRLLSISSKAKSQEKVERLILLRRKFLLGSTVSKKIAN